MSIWVAIGGTGSRNHIAHPDVYTTVKGERRVSEYRYTWCGIKIDRRQRRYSWTPLLPGSPPITCDLCLMRLTRPAAPERKELRYE